jgi:hypothetical protein
MKLQDRLLVASLFLAASALTALLLVTGCGGSSNTGGTTFMNGPGQQTGNDNTPTGGSDGGTTGTSSGDTTGGGSGGGTSGGGSGGTGSSSGGNGGGVSDGGGAPSTGSDASTPPTPHGTSTCLKAGSGDYSKAGPYTVATKANIDLSVTGDLPTGGDAGPTTATAFYPSDLNDNCPHPIVSWANGTGVTGSSTYSFFNNNAASWGIVVMAADNPNSAGGSFGGGIGGGGGGGGPYNRAGIDYLLKANNDSSSVFYHHLSTRAGVAGHSQGAFAATLATSHPNVEAEVQVEGGGVPKAGIDFLALTGSADNVVGTMSPMMSYNSATGPSMFAEYMGADHVTTPTAGGYFQMNPGTIQFMRFYTAWWRCFLADDQTACAMFKGGSSCGVCKDPNWTSLQTKNM